MSSPLDRAHAAVKRLKVFPLSSVVLFPGSALPLNIFEQRYRDMVTDALATDSVIAMAQVDLSDTEPTLKPIITVGHIILHEPQADGRFHLLLGGLARARVLRELPQEKLYREVEAELLIDVAATHERMEVQLQQSLLELTQRLPADVATRVLKVAARTHGGALADVVANTVVTNVERRYAVLSTVDVPTRMNLVLEEVSGLMAQLKPSRPQGFLN